jgi:hypothetical protein
MVGEDPQSGGKHDQECAVSRSFSWQIKSVQFLARPGIARCTCRHGRHSRRQLNSRPFEGDGPYQMMRASMPGPPTARLRSVATVQMIGCSSVGSNKTRGDCTLGYNFMNSTRKGTLLHLKMDTNNFQRLGALSNAHVGRDFEAIAKEYFQLQGVELNKDFPVLVGASQIKKARQFDLGSTVPPVLVECKSHRWTSGGNIPSAKLTVWNEAMYYFNLAPAGFRKVLFVLRDFSSQRGESLASYYFRTFGHLGRVHASGACRRLG